MKDMHGLIFTHRNKTSLRELTANRAIGSIPFGGRYRIIDFVISGMVNSHITDIGVIMRDNYQSLLDHLGSGKDWDLSRKRGGLRLLPPFGLTNGNMGHDSYSYRGKMDALISIQSYIKRIRQKYIVLAEDDLVSNINLEEAVDFHIRTGADITAVCTENKTGDPRENTYLCLDDNGRAVEVITNPEQPTGLLSLGIFILETELLERLIEHCASRKLYRFDEDVLQRMHDDLNIFGYAAPGYAELIQSTGIYFRENLRLLQKDVRDSLFVKGRPIKTKLRDDAPTYYAPESHVENSIVADGCYIEGEVRNSILFRGVRVQKGAKISNSILMQDTVVSSGAILNDAITDKSVLINPGRMLMGHETYPIVISKGAIV